MRQAARPLLPLLIKRGLNTSNSIKSATTTATAAVSTKSSTSSRTSPSPSSSSPSSYKPTYLDSLSNKLLFSYASIGLCTLNKPILNTVIALFPLIPTPLLDFFIGKIYCGGSTPAEVIKTGENLSARGINNMMLSLTIEDSEGIKNIDINYIVDETTKSVDTILKPHILKLIESGAEDINSIPPGYIVIKPSALVSKPVDVLLNYKNPEYKDQWNTLVNNCCQITDKVSQLNEELSAKYPERESPFFVTVIDAEKYDLQQGVYELQRSLYSKYNKLNKPIQVVGTFQMYLKDSFDQIKKEESLAKENGYRVGLKLVRGAYIHSEPDRQVIHDTKQDTDMCYNNGVKYALDDLASNSSKATLGHLIVASHNAASSKLASKEIATSKNTHFKANVVLGQLLGMADDVTYDLIKTDGIKNIIKYVPWGPPVETKDYLLRRLQENGDAVRNDNGWPLVKNVFKVYKHRLFGL